MLSISFDNIFDVSNTLLEMMLMLEMPWVKVQKRPGEILSISTAVQLTNSVQMVVS
jgi:hypothetical protein